MVRLTTAQVEASLGQLLHLLNSSTTLHRRARALHQSLARWDPHDDTLSYEAVMVATVGKDEVTTFGQFRRDLNAAAATNSVGLALEVDGNKKGGSAGRECWFVGTPVTAKQIERSSTATTASQGQAVASDGLPQDAAEAQLRVTSAKTPMRVHIEHSEDQLDAAQELAKLLQLRLNLHTKLTTEGVATSLTTCELLGGQELAQVQLRRDQADVILLILSYQWSDLYMSAPPWPSMRPVLPICGELVPHALEAGLIRLGSAEPRQVFRPDTGWPVQHKAQGKFVDELSPRLVDALLERTPQALQLQLDREAPLEHTTLVSGTGVRFNLGARGEDWKSAITARSQRADAVKVVDYLEDWACTANDKPYGVILGETGSGKTTAARVLNNRLNERWRSQQPSDTDGAPLSIYLDLRLVDTTHRRSPSLRALINNVIAKVWETEEFRSIDADAILDQVRNHGALLIFDGLDEVLVHLDDQEGRDFVRQLWGALPPARTSSSGRPTAGIPGRLLLTCRTHYFPTVDAERSFLRGEDREHGIENLYEAVHLLPFNNEQVRAYFEHFLGEASQNDKSLPRLSSDDAMALLADIHNLSELAERPYNLSLIAAQIARLEHLRADGRRVSLSDLYNGFVTDWLHRDDGKHQFDLAHKRLLMERLAAHLWREGTRTMTYSAMDEWLSVQLDEVPVLRRWFQQTTPSLGKLVEDLRTATFVVRPGVDRFEFAHTSLLEFFLASYLARALINREADAWVMPSPSAETAEFLVDLLAGLAADPDRSSEADAARATLRELGDAYRPQASEVAFRYCIAAYGSPAITRPLAGFNLTGASLRHLKLEGAVGEPLLNLSACRLVGADLRDARLLRVRLDGAELMGARLDRAELVECSVQRAQLEGADLSATTFRDCRLTGIDLSQATTNRTKVLRCETTHAAFGGDQFGAILPALNNGAEPGFRHQVGTAGTTIQPETTGQTGSVWGLAHSPDGTEVATASAHGITCIWDATTGETLHTLTGHTGAVWGVTYSPSGNLLATASDDNTARIWDTTTGETVHTLTGHSGAVLGVTYFPGGNLLATASDDNTARIWDTTTGETVHTLTGHTHWVWGAAYSPDGNHLTTASADGTVCIRDATTGQTLHALTGHSGAVLGLAYSPDGTKLATASADDTARIWDTTTAETLHTFSGHTGAVWGVAYSPDGTELATASDDDTARIWDTTTGETLHTLTGHTGTVRRVAYSPEGTELATAGGDGTARIWDTTTGEILHTLIGHTNSVRGVTYSPDGSQLTTASNGTARIWDTTTAETLHTIAGHAGGNVYTGGAWCLAYSPDGSHLAIAGGYGAAHIWDTITGKILHTLTGHTNSVWGVAYSADGIHLTTASADGTARIWDATTGIALHTLTGHTGALLGVAYSPDGTQLTTAGGDGTAGIWDATTGETRYTLAGYTRLTGHTGAVWGVAYSPVGKQLATASFDGTARIWDARTGETIHILTGHIGPVRGIAYSPDGALLATAGGDGTARVWDTATGKSRRTLTGHTDSVRGVAYSPSGTRLATASDDGTARIWDTTTGETLQLHHHFDARSTATFSGSGELIRAHGESWRYLSVLATDPHGQQVRLPAETFGALPGIGPGPFAARADLP